MNDPILDLSIPTAIFALSGLYSQVGIESAMPSAPHGSYIGGRHRRPGKFAANRLD